MDVVVSVVDVELIDTVVLKHLTFAGVVFVPNSVNLCKYCTYQNFMITTGHNHIKLIMMNLA